MGESPVTSEPCHRPMNPRSARSVPAAQTSEVPVRATSKSVPEGGLGIGSPSGGLWTRFQDEPFQYPASGIPPRLAGELPRVPTTHASVAERTFTAWKLELHRVVRVSVGST